MASSSKGVVGGLLGVCCGAAGAAEPVEAQPYALSVVALLAASFEPDPIPGLTGQETNSALSLALNFQMHPHFAIGLDYNGYGQQFDSGVGGPVGFFGTASDRMDLDTAAWSLQALLMASAPRASAYAGAGIGAYRTRLKVDADTIFGIPATVVDESDTDVGHHLVAGAAVGLTESSWLALQFRHVTAEADFGTRTGGAIDVGGTFFFIGYQYRVRL